MIFAWEVGGSLGWCTDYCCIVADRVADHDRQGFSRNDLAGERVHYNSILVGKPWPAKNIGNFPLELFRLVMRYETSTTREDKLGLEIPTYPLAHCPIYPAYVRH